MVARGKENKMTIFCFQCQVPEKKNLKTFVSRPPSAGLRLYCTMIRSDTENFSNYIKFISKRIFFLFKTREVRRENI